jgi:phosphate transport system protein
LGLSFIVRFSFWEGFKIMVANRTMFDRQLGTLRDQVVQISDLVEQSIVLSMKALQNHDLPAAHLVDQFDSTINARRFAAEEYAYQLLALQQPNAGDLRLIVALVSVVTNLERIGDHAAGIARLTVRLGPHPAVETPTFFGEMTTSAQWLVRNAMTALVTSDIALAKKVIERDHMVDHLHQDVYRQLIETMTTHLETVEAATLLLWISHNLERIGDRATNIASRVPYLVNGELVRNPDAAP